MNYVWDLSVVLQSFPILLKGLLYTIGISIISMAISLPFGIIMSVVRLSRLKIFRSLTSLYIDFFRCTPILAQLFWVYYSVPIILGVTMSSITTGILALSLNLTAYIAEIVRAGIQAIEKGQTEAAYAIGMTQAQNIRRIILPQAIRKIIPPLGSTWISLFKDTSLLSVIVVPEMMYEANVFVNLTFRPVEIYTVAALIYFVVTFLQSRFVDRLYEKGRVRS